MTASISGSLTINASVSKSVTTNDPTATPPSLTLSIGNLSNSWNSTSTPNGLDAWSGLVTMTSGTATIDLTSLTQAGLAGTISMSGFKMRYIQVQPSTGNAAPISVAVGASNGYPSFGTIAVLNPGDMAARTTVLAIAVDGTHKTIDITGTGADSMEILVVFGS